MVIRLTTLEVCVLIAAGLALILKTIHFFSKIKRRKIIYWFYFTPVSIMGSRNRESAKAKKIQNNFSMIAMALILIAAVIMFLNK